MFEDGKTYNPKIQARSREGSGSQVIDLPGKQRSIDGVEFVYRSVNRKQARPSFAVRPLIREAVFTTWS